MASKAHHIKQCSSSVAISSCVPMLERCEMQIPTWILDSDNNSIQTLILLRSVVLIEQRFYQGLRGNPTDPSKVCHYSCSVCSHANCNLATWCHIIGVSIMYAFCHCLHGYEPKTSRSHHVVTHTTRSVITLIYIHSIKHCMYLHVYTT